ncbi:MAG TPA: ABC transporter ATP-binding protein [Acidimicrobiales bacterium]|nr:ABC transporter ATP-binding protein [Acidimicrobiales bacterium]
MNQGGGTAAPILELQDVYAGYGRVPVLHGISLAVQPGEIVALLGANGAGKSTTLRVISRLLAHTSGSVTFDGADVARLTPAALVRAGLVHVPEGRRIFAGLTVEENLLVAGYTLASTRKARKRLAAVTDLFPILGARHNQTAGLLSGGEQQQLAIGRAMMLEPRVVLLDEPSLGLAPLVVESLADTITALNTDRGVAILLVEQDLALAERVAHRGYVLETGTIVSEGLADEVITDEAISQIYLGADRGAP